MNTNTFTLLEKDHKKVKSIIKELLDTTSQAKVKRKNLLLELKEELQQHEQIEENFVYPVLKDKKLTHDLAMQAYEEHHVVDVLLEEIEVLEFNDESWKAKLTVLQENLLHHIKEEEENLFIKAEKTLTKDELTNIREDITEAKKVG